jgi:hypothetical protein
MQLKRIGLQSNVSAPGVTGDWFEVGHQGTTGIDLLGSFVRLEKGARVVMIPMANVSYFMPLDQVASDAMLDSPYVYLGNPPAEATADEPPVSTAENHTGKRSVGRPRKHPLPPIEADES